MHSSLSKAERVFVQNNIHEEHVRGWNKAKRYTQQHLFVRPRHNLHAYYTHIGTYLYGG